MILADYFYDKYNYDFDIKKVFELLLYHDIVEIEIGDAHLFYQKERAEKKKLEFGAAKELSMKLPEEIKVKYMKLFDEYETTETPEAKFAKAIDALDAIIHELDYKEDWKGWSEDFLKDKKLKHLKDFPELEREFYKLLQFQKENGYFNQN